MSEISAKYLIYNSSCYVGNTLFLGESSLATMLRGESPIEARNRSASRG